MYKVIIALLALGLAVGWAGANGVNSQSPKDPTPYVTVRPATKKEQLKHDLHQLQVCDKDPHCEVINGIPNWS